MPARVKLRSSSGRTKNAPPDEESRLLAQFAHFPHQRVVAFACGGRRTSAQGGIARLPAYPAR
jgi:hypothetical protein